MRCFIPLLLLMHAVAPLRSFEDLLFYPLKHEESKHVNWTSGAKDKVISLQKNVRVVQKSDSHSVVTTTAAERKMMFQRLHDIPRVKEYCNSPSEPVTGSEGEAPEGFRLRLVHIFLRHGERTANHEIPGYRPEPVQCYVNQKLLNSDSKLKDFVPTLEKFAGKRPYGSYFQNWELLPNKSQCGGARLTGTGAVQHLKLGQYFHDKYLAKSSFFNKQLPLTSQVYTRSTRYSRTFQSAIAFLYGFLPVNVFNLTALKFEDSFYTSFCSPVHSGQETCYCSHGNSLHQQVYKLNKHFVRNSVNGKQVINTLARTFELDASNVPSFSLLMDIFSLAACHNMSNPCSVRNDKSCLTASQYQQIWDLLDEEGSFLLHESQKTYAKYSNLFLYPVLIEIVKRMKEEIENPQPYKLVIYSGHDVTLTPLLTVLGLDDGRWVRYASRVVIELYEAINKKDKHRYYLRFLFNGKDLTENVKFCEGKTFRGLCKFELFNDFVITEMLQQFEYLSYNEACSRI